MTASPETDITAADFAGYARGSDRSASFNDRRTAHLCDVLVEGRAAATVKGLYDEHAVALWRYARRLTRDPARAQDVVQETLLRAWQHPEVANDSERSARSWLFTVARNMIIDESRSATVPP